MRQPKSHSLWISTSLTLMIFSLAAVVYRTNQPDFSTNTSSRADSSSELTTGYLYSPPSDQSRTFLAKFDNLVSQTPISGAGFIIEYSTENDTVKVTLYSPYEASRSNFTNWIRSNNYADLPKDYFTVVVSTDIQPTPTPSNNHPATGYLDIATSSRIAGWARDNDIAGPVNVHIYIDGAFHKSTTANLYRSDVGNHAFDTTITTTPGSHTVNVYAIGVNSLGTPTGSNPQIGNSPKTVIRPTPTPTPRPPTATPRPPTPTSTPRPPTPTPIVNNYTATGYLDSATATTVGGWARDNDIAGPVNVHIYIDGAFHKSTTANLYRSDVGYHAFNTTITIPATGNHTVAAYAIGVRSDGSVSGSNPQLFNSPRFVAYPTPTPVPPTPTPIPVTNIHTARGWLDLATAYRVAGWARDDDYSGPISVHIYIDGAFHKAVSANLYREDVGYHAFDTSISVPAGSHRINVYAIGAKSDGSPSNWNPEISSSPKTVNR